MTTRRPGSPRRSLGGAVFAIALLGALPSAHGSGAAASTIVVVKVTIVGHPLSAPFSPGPIVFAPKTIKTGTVIFQVSNKDQDQHIFSINGANTGWINAAGRATIKVTFKRPGVYTGSCPDDDLGGLSGVLKVT